MKLINFLENWAEALESGEYEQATGSLRGIAKADLDKQDDFKIGECCLGVAALCLGPNAVTHIDETWDLDIKKDSIVFRSNLDDRDYHEGTLPKSIKEALGLNLGVGLKDPIFNTFSDFQERLYSMNDAGRSFEEIADYIRKYVIPEVIKKGIQDREIPGL